MPIHCRKRRKMKSKTKALLIAVAFIPFLLAASNGFPSRPRFQAVGINTTAPATAGQMIAAGNIRANVASASFTAKGTASGASSFSWLEFTDSGDVRKGYVGDDSAGTSDVSLGCDTAPCNVNILPGGTGLPMLKGIPFGNCATTLLLGGAGAGSFISGDCPFTGTSTSRSAAGTYVFNFATVVLGANGLVVCTIRENSSTNKVLTVAGITTGSFTLRTTLGSTGVDTDSSANVFCLLHI